MQRFIALYIKQSARSNNSKSSTKKLLLSTEIAGVYFVLKSINQTKKNECGGYKHSSAKLVREFSSIHLSCPKFKREIGI